MKPHRRRPRSRGRAERHGGCSPRRRAIAPNTRRGSGVDHRHVLQPSGSAQGTDAATARSNSGPFRDVARRPGALDTLEMLPWASALAKERAENHSKDYPPTYCLPSGPAPLIAPGFFQLVQHQEVLLMLFETDTPGVRQVFLDGRRHPKTAESLWLGYSIGKWEKDTLVIETVGFKDSGWLSSKAILIPTSCASRIVSVVRIWVTLRSKSPSTILVRLNGHGRPRRRPCWRLTRKCGNTSATRTTRLPCISWANESRWSESRGVPTYARRSAGVG